MKSSLHAFLLLAVNSNPITNNTASLQIFVFNVFKLLFDTWRYQYGLLFIQMITKPCGTLLILGEIKSKYNIAIKRPALQAQAYSDSKHTFFLLISPQKLWPWLEFIVSFFASIESGQTFNLPGFGNLTIFHWKLLRTNYFFFENFPNWTVFVPENSRYSTVFPSKFPKATYQGRIFVQYFTTPKAHYFPWRLVF